MEIHKGPGPKKQADDEGIVDSHDIRHKRIANLMDAAEIEDTRTI
jgi:hypothetical protein